MTITQHQRHCLDDAARFIRVAAAVLHRLVEEDDDRQGIPYFVQVAGDAAAECDDLAKQLADLAGKGK